MNRDELKRHLHTETDPYEAEYRGRPLPLLLNRQGRTHMLSMVASATAGAFAALAIVALTGSALFGLFSEGNAGLGPEAASPSLDEAPGLALAPPDAAARRELAELYMLDDPPQDAEFERYISPEEYTAVMVPCLTEQGIPARALPDGGVGFEDIPPEQSLLQREAMYRCSVQFPTHPMFDVPLNDDQLRRLYGYLAGDLTTCLKDEGYATTPPPTVEVFIDSYNGAGSWSPWPVNDSRLQNEAEWYRLNEVCPQTPPLDVLYGGAVNPDGD